MPQFQNAEIISIHGMCVSICKTANNSTGRWHLSHFQIKYGSGTASIR
jgi:hypothetical protein